MGYYFYYSRENKIFVARNAEFFENNLIVQEARGSHGLLKSSMTGEGLELIQEEDTQPSENTSKEHNEVAPTKEHELGDLNEPPNYKAALSDPEFDKWLEAMNTEIPLQSHILHLLNQLNSRANGQFHLLQSQDKLRAQKDKLKQKLSSQAKPCISRYQPATKL
ncbi:hypothetical protein Tco_0824349 [Tanacetum coccineum]|uniref:Uncharacterized protein n=1 Tax=Tanacetum coccineum TaxID=301880 RepID=A0ABQ5AKK7_9ASTR